jgi:methyl-accepting chemotaxis protein
VGYKMKLMMGGLVALTTTVLIVAVLLVARLGADDRLGQQEVAFATAASESALQAKGVANDERGFLISGDQDYLDEAVTRIAQTRSALLAAQRSTEDQAQLRLVQAASAGFERWVAALEQEFATYSTDKGAAIRASLGPTRDLRKAYEANLTAAQTLGHVSVTAAQSAVSTVAARATQVLLVCLVVVLIAGIAVSTWIIRFVATPLQNLAALLMG